MSQESAALASLCDVVSELVAGLAAGDTVTKGWAYEAVAVLEQTQRGFGYTPSLTAAQIEHWKGEE